jgi:hypothetical protein
MHCTIEWHAVRSLFVGLKVLIGGLLQGHGTVSQFGKRDWRIVIRRFACKSRFEGFEDESDLAQPSSKIWISWKSKAGHLTLRQLVDLHLQEAKIAYLSACSITKKQDFVEQPDGSHTVEWLVSWQFT